MDEIRNFMKVLLEHRQSSNGLSYGGMTMAECREMIQKALQQPKVKFVMEAMEKSGCPLNNPTNFIRPIKCVKPATASYIPGRGIVICSNYLRFQDEVTQGVAHELIHAYDDCRAKNLNWSNCYHHACAEIRASRLSGDCHYMREYLRGHKNLRGHEPDCVRRRATSSTSANPHCTEYLTKMALDSVWDICYNDTKPFDKVKIATCKQITRMVSFARIQKLREILADIQPLKVRNRASQVKRIAHWLRTILIQDSLDCAIFGASSKFAANKSISYRLH